jgi:hypothetical protein
METYRKRAKLLLAKHDVREPDGGLPYQDNVGPFVIGACIFAALGMGITFKLGTAQEEVLGPCQANLVFIRHGEKINDQLTNLSKIGAARAGYLSHCMSKGNTKALWLGPPTHLLTFKVYKHKSTRGVDTLKPLAKVLNQTIDSRIDAKDAPGFVAELRSKLSCQATIVVAWSHDNFGALVHSLDPPNAYDFLEWPTNCPSHTFAEPVDQPGCFDAIWSIPLSKSNGTDASEPWTVANVRPFHEGFGGSATSPCAQDLAPLPTPPLQHAAAVDISSEAKLAVAAE